jgi:hypothetical protein
MHFGHIDFGQGKRTRVGLSFMRFTAWNDRMISMTDCTAMCGAIAEHEQNPEIAAAALGQYLLGPSGGPEAIRDMIRDDSCRALARNERRHAHELFMTLRHILSEHPNCSGRG